MITYRTFPGREPKMDAISPADHALEDQLYPDRAEGFYAELNCRAIMYWGKTEQEAITALVNGVAELVAKGHLDPLDPSDTADLPRL